MTTEQLYEIIKVQQKQINDLEKELLSLRQWSDDNDYYLREMIDALTENVDKTLEDIKINKSNIACICGQCKKCHK